MELRVLLQQVDDCTVHGDDAVAVAGIAYRSQDVGLGSVFVALPGASVDGHDFVPAAIEAGASVVVVNRPLELSAAVVQVVVPDTRRALAQLAAVWYGDPSAALRVIGITGTNGKTTLTYMLESIWRAARRSTGIIGTVAYRFAEVERSAPHTTPESAALQALLREMADAGVSDVALEVSSHGIAQSRVTACHFDGAIFTNLSQDHLDYHDSLADYAATKTRLFSELLPASNKELRFAVINADDPVGQQMIAACPERVWRYGLHAEADVFPTAKQCDVQGTSLTLETPHGQIELRSPFVGEHNIYNVLAAVTAAMAMGISSADIIVGIESMSGVPGRLERVEVGSAVSVFVDYAHTPDALRAVCSALRPLTQQRLITVMGCGGDRDRSKRPLMGEAAATCSDLVIATSDNPRTEDPTAIVRDIVPGLQDVEHELVVDRRAAIARALEIAVDGDVVLIAGKGHEDYQIVGTTKHHFDDREVVREIGLGASQLRDHEVARASGEG